MGKQRYPASALVVSGLAADAVAKAVTAADLKAVALPRMPAQAQLRSLKLPRIALLHTWFSTQTEGWWRMALDYSGVPYDYLSTQDIAGLGRLRERYDVILFGPTDAESSQLIIDGLPRWNNALPWLQTELTPNLGSPDATADMRPGLGQDGVVALKAFVEQGGLLITSADTAQFAIDIGLAPGVRMHDGGAAKVVGSILRAHNLAPGHAMLAGFGESFPVHSSNGSHFTLSQLLYPRNLPNAHDHQRPTGRGGPEETDLPEMPGYPKPVVLPKPEPWEAQELNAEQLRDNPFVIPAALRPRALLRFGDDEGLLVAGLLADAGPIARRAIVVDARHGQGHTLLFGINPLWRGQTLGSYGLVFNAILGWQQFGP